MHRRTEKVNRQLVDHDHGVKLVRDYWKRFGVYSKNRKKAVVQLVPKKVWQNIYADYKLTFPNSTFKDDNLKDQLKDPLKDMKSGINMVMMPLCKMRSL